MLEPKIPSLPGIIMEFKAVKEEKAMIDSAVEALRQINSKHYDTALLDRGIHDIVKYGIAFAGKKSRNSNVIILKRDIAETRKNGKTG